MAFHACIMEPWEIHMSDELKRVFSVTLGGMVLVDLAIALGFAASLLAE